MAGDQLLYVGQKAFIAKDNQVLVLFDPHLGLDFPGGKIQAGETDLVDSLQREVREETNLEITVSDPFFAWLVELPPHHRNAGKKIYLVGWRCRYLSGEIKLSDEHNRYQWVSENNYRALDDGSDYFKALETYWHG